MSKTVKIKTSELIDDALNYAVSVAEGYKPVWTDGRLRPVFQLSCTVEETWPAYSTDWAQGGPIIERERMTLGYTGLGNMAEEHRRPEAYYLRTLFEEEEGWYQRGPTPLIAAMRCYVASKLGHEVEIPKELLKE